MSVSEIVAGQLEQRSTQVAILSSVALLVGWQLSPDKIDAIVTLVAVVQAITLAVLQERRATKTTTSTTVTAENPPEPAITVKTTTTTVEDLTAKEAAK